MQIYLSIDDTDNLDSPGSGHLAEAMAKELQQLGLTSQCANISRHQLFVHEHIPYTSHNSSMCFPAVINEHNLANVTQFAKEFLKKAAAPGSDPGLCIAVERESLDRQTLIDFGLQAKKTVFTKQDAYVLAERTGVHLSEHGGTGEGIIGALAGIGLRLQGSDGRFRGWLSLGNAGQTTSHKSLCSHAAVDAVVDEAGMILPEDALVTFAEDKVKTVCLNHRQVIPVSRSSHVDGPAWTTLTRAEVKHF
ncbi:hypothetical protein [Desulfocastanea catecholica]